MSEDEASGDAAELERVLGDLARLRIDSHRVSPGYRCVLLLVTVVMLLLPLLYFGLVGAFAFWVASCLSDPPDAGRGLAWCSHLLLWVAGPASVFFLIKPWFTGGTDDEEGLVLEPGEAADLECFVGLLARAVGAPGPRQIKLDCGVNAAAGYSGGWRGMLGKDLTLTLGLPLVAGLDLRSFAGVLAHELGHFSQCAGMRLAWMIMAVNKAFDRSVNQRDRWDQRLQDAARSDRGHVQLFGLATLSLVWAARQPLWLLMWAGRFISGFALRQLEFDADGYEIVFAGSDTFRKTSREIKLLGVGVDRALQLIGDTLPEGKLPKNLPMLARVQTQELSQRVRQAVEEEMMGRRAGIRAGATHPSDRERIEVAESYGAPGLLHSRLLARVLFDDFDVSAERVTKRFYGSRFDLDLSGCELVDMAAFEGAVALREKRFAASETFFGDRLTLARAPVFTADEIATMYGGHGVASRGQLAENAEAMRRWLAEGGEAFERFDRAEKEMLEVARTTALFHAGFRLRRRAFGLPRSLAALSERRRAAGERHARALVGMAEFDRIARRRISWAVARHLAGASVGARAERLQTRRVLRALEAMGALFPTLSQMRRRLLAQGAILQNIRPATLSRSVAEQLNRNVTELSELSVRCREALRRVPYPFEHASGKISMAEYASARFSGYGLVMASYKTTETMLERLFDVYFRLLGHLCAVTSEVEAEAGDS